MSLPSFNVQASPWFFASIDTGIDYNHPFLGSNGFGPGKKIVTGYDFAGNDFNFDNSTAEPKPDPMDCNGHGTHVAVRSSGAASILGD